MATTKDDWYIKHMPKSNQARRRITAYAAEKGITIPQAIQEIVILAGI